MTHAKIATKAIATRTSTKASASNKKTTTGTSGPATKAATGAVAKTLPKTSPAAAVVKVLAGPKPKLVRDSFTIPKSEHAVLQALKLRAVQLARPAKKSELLRAGIGVLHAMSDAALLSALDAVPSLKTGRPKSR